jgi:hypothetical protein
MSPFLYRCPNTSLQVQDWAQNVEPSTKEGQETYQGVHCPVCARFHLVNPKTGKLCGEGETGGTARRFQARML